MTGKSQIHAVHGVRFTTSSSNFLVFEADELFVLPFTMALTTSSSLRAIEFDSYGVSLSTQGVSRQGGDDERMMNVERDLGG